MNSAVGRRAGTDMILYVTVNVRLGERLVDERFGDCIEYYLAPGTQHKTWSWIFPKREVVTLGTGGYMDGGFVSAHAPSVKAYMQSFLDLPAVASGLEGGEIVAWGLHLEFDGELERRVDDGVILAGQAGGFVAPFLGQGMPEAFLTGIYVAQAAERGIISGDLSRSSLEAAHGELVDASLFMKAFHHLAAQNTASILSRPDGEIAAMMQNVVLGGGFITNVVHTRWLQGAEEERMEVVKEASEILGLLGPCRQIRGDFEELYRQRGK